MTNKEWKIANRERINQLQREYYRRNVDKLTAKHRKQNPKCKRYIYVVTDFNGVTKEFYNLNAVAFYLGYSGSTIQKAMRGKDKIIYYGDTILRTNRYSS